MLKTLDAFTSVPPYPTRIQFSSWTKLQMLDALKLEFTVNIPSYGAKLQGLLPQAKLILVGR